MKYPPFCDIIKIEVSDLNDESAEKAIIDLYEKLLNYNDKNMSIYSPMPSPISKIKDRYRWRIIIKCKVGNNVISEINNAINNIGTSNNTRISVDINPNNMN